MRRSKKPEGRCAVTTNSPETYPRTVHALASGLSVCGRPPGRPSAWSWNHGWVHGHDLLLMTTRTAATASAVPCEDCLRYLRRHAADGAADAPSVPRSAPPRVSIPSDAMVVRVNAYDVMERAVGEGIEAGWRRANKHEQLLPDPKSSKGYVAIEHLVAAVMEAVVEVFLFPAAMEEDEG